MKPLKTQSADAQLNKFKDAALDLGTDDREEAFDEKLKHVARKKRPEESKESGA